MIRKWVMQLNHNFEKFPQESAAALFGCEILSIFGTYHAIAQSGVNIPPSLAIGFAFSRPFRRVRLPIELLFAGGLKRIIPELADVKMTSLIGGQVPDALQKNSILERIKNWRATIALSNIIDSYGACYFIGARWTGVISVLTFTALIDAGVDVQPYIESLGFSVNLGNQLSTWAAAVTLSSFVYPFSMAFGGIVIAPALGTARLKFRGVKQV